MMHPIRAIFTVLGFAAVTATSGLALLTPHVTHADGEERKGVYNSGVVTAYASFEKDDTAKNGWKIVIAADNPGNADATDDFDLAISYAVSNPNSRVGSPGTAVWRHKEKLTVAAHESTTKTLECPASIAKQLTAIDKAQTKRDALLASFQDKDKEVPQWVWNSFNAPRASYWIEATATPQPQPKGPAPKVGQANAKAKGKA
jgi:hypothetical protein